MKEVSRDDGEFFNTRNDGERNGGTGVSPAVFDQSRTEATSETGVNPAPGVTEMVPSDFEQAISTTVVRRVANEAGVEPTALPPLYEWIDPDALDALFASRPGGKDRSGRIEFPYLDYEIAVDCEDETTITVTERTPE